MLRTIGTISTMAIMILGVLAVGLQSTEAATYRIVIKINFANSAQLKCIDEIYARVSDSKADANGEHSTLVGKFTIDNPTQTSYVKSFTFDPRKVPSGYLREYMTLLQDEQIVYKDYKHPYTPFEKSRTQYTFTHNIPTSFTC